MTGTNILDALTEEEKLQEVLKVTDTPILDAYLNEVILGTKKPIDAVASKLKLTKSLINSRICKNQSYLKQEVDRYFKECAIDKLRVLTEVKDIAFFSISDFAEFNGGELDYKDWTSLPESVKKCVKDVQVTENTKLGTKTVHFTFYDKQRALDQLMKLLEIGAVNVKHSGEIQHSHRMFDDVYANIRNGAINAPVDNGTNAQAA
jgi:hypothetical protein